MRVFVKEIKMFWLEFTEEELKAHTQMLLNVNPVNAEMVTFRKEQQVQCEKALKVPPMSRPPDAPPGLGD